MKDDVATVPNRCARCEAASRPNCHLICPGPNTCQLLGPSEPTYVHITKSMTCSHEGLFFLVPVGMKDDVATVPNWIARCEAAAWPNCHLIWPGSTWKLLGPSEPTYVHIAKSMTCSHEGLFFLVPVGMKDDVATVPNRCARCEAASRPNCHLICPGSTCQLSWAHQNPPTSTSQKV